MGENERKNEDAPCMKRCSNSYFGRNFASLDRASFDPFFQDPPERMSNHPPKKSEFGEYKYN